MFNKELLLMGSSEKPIMFKIVYFEQEYGTITPSLTVDYTDPTTNQTVTHSINHGDSYSFPCAIGDTVKFYYSEHGIPDKGYAYKFFNGVDVSPTSGQESIPGNFIAFTITGKSPFLNYNIGYYY